jgi:hypothetical protein
MKKTRRILKAYPLTILFLSVCSGAQQGKPDEKPANPPAVNRNLVIQGLPVGSGYEQFRPLISAYLKEIEASGDYKNWKVAPASAYER